MKLSTRPEKFLGEVATWDRAEDRLRTALDAFTKQGGVQWELNTGDGAFYGPKIDITISDALKREFQCATIQLDFQLPQQFNLEYVTPSMNAVDHEKKDQKEKGKPVDKPNGDATQVSTSAQPSSNTINAQLSAPAPANPQQAADHKPPEKSYRKDLTPGCARPVMIHRAIYGSLERFIAILCEHFGGKWPFWLSPRQVLVIPVMPSANDYVQEVQAALREQGFHADVDITGNTMQKKIRSGQIAQYNYIWVLGAQEKEARTANIRDRDDQATQSKGEMVGLDDAIEKLKALRESRTLPVVAPIGGA